MSVFQSNQYSVWAGVQSAKGSAVAYDAVRKALRVISGGLTVTKEFGAESYGDGNRFSNASDYITQLLGTGTLTIQGQPGVAGYIAYLALGNDSYTAADVDSSAIHTITPSDNGGKWATFFYTVGEGTTAIRQKYADCRVSQVAFEASSGTPTLHVTPTIVSLDPGATVASNAMPTIAPAPVEPMLFTELSGSFTVDGTSYGEVSQFQVTVSDDLTPLFGDDVKAFDMAAGRSTVEATFTMVATSDTIGAWNKLVYGTANPGAGTEPSKDVFYGGLSMSLTRGTGLSEERFSITIPRLAFTAAPAIEGQADGGAIELSFTGQGRPNGNDPIITIEIASSDLDDDDTF